MKIKSLIAVLIILISSSCSDQFDGLTNFTLEYTHQSKIDSNVGVNLPFNISTPPVQTNSTAEFKNENTAKNLIEEIYIEQLKITLTSPSNADFSFLENITIYINADGKDEQEIAWKKPVPSNAGASITLDINDTDLQEYIVQDEFSLRINATTDELIASDHHFEVFTKFRVKAKLLN